MKVFYLCYYYNYIGCFVFILKLSVSSIQLWYSRVNYFFSGSENWRARDMRTNRVFFLPNINIWGHLWSKCGHLTPRGIHVWGYHPLLCHLFRGNTIMFCPECIFLVPSYYQMTSPNRKVLWIIPIFGFIFRQNVGFWSPGVSHV